MTISGQGGTRGLLSRFIPVTPGGQNIAGIQRHGNLGVTRFSEIVAPPHAKATASASPRVWFTMPILPSVTVQMDKLVGDLGIYGGTLY
jgi:hypothetical protein